jgi:tetratricopeptide (TPR) repeat protein
MLLAASPQPDNILDRSRFYEIEAVTNPNDDNWYQAGICRLVRGDVERSIVLFERIKRMKPEAHYYLGVAYYQLGDYDRAAHNFEEFCAMRSWIWQPCYYLGLIYLKQSKIAEAMPYLQKIPENAGREYLMNHVLDYQRLEEARSRFFEHDYEHALDLYNQVEDFFGYREMGLALTYAKLGRYEESLALLDTIINHSPDTALARSGLFESGRQLVQLRHLGKAKKYLREYLKMTSDDNARFLMGTVFSDESRFDSARVYFKGLPDSVDAFLFYQGRTEYFLGFWSRAEIKLLKHRERFPASHNADRTLYILASINFKRKKYDNAIAFWRELVDRFPQSIYAASAQQEIGHSYFNVGDYGSALNAYNRVEQYDPSDDIASEVTLRIYETKFYLHKLPSLIDVLRKYIRENPNSRLVSRTKLRIAKLLYDGKRYYQSMHEIDRIIEDHPGTEVAVEARMLRVQTSQAIANKFELVHSLQSLLLSENAAEYRLYAANELAALWVEEAKYDSALFYYNLLLKSETYRESSILKIADIYDRLGHTKESIAMVERLISEYPKSIYLAEAYMLHSRALRGQGDYDSAIQMLLKVSEGISDRAELYMELGNLYFDVEEFNAARQNFLKACEISKQNREEAAQALLRAGDASVKIGDKTGGKEYYLKANMIAESALLKNQAMQKLTTITED